jgi:trans-L-3-hydroxyproline dehydratase
VKLDWDARPPSAGSEKITTLDMHAAGEPLRIVTGGMAELKGATILERRRYMRDHLDHVRRALMWEPRGHYDMYGAIVTPPVSEGADVGVLFMHNEGYSTMCGHGIIALVEEIAVESILGRSSVFRGRAVESTRVGSHDAIIAEVGGTAYMTGRSEFVVDPRDTLGSGFLLG